MDIVSNILFLVILQLTLAATAAGSVKSGLCVVTTELEKEITIIMKLPTSVGLFKGKRGFKGPSSNQYLVSSL